MECLYHDHCRFGNLVTTSNLKWVPLGNQSQLFTAESVGPVDDDILLCKMRPGHELDIELHATKGIGRDHAKFSPVGRANCRKVHISSRAS